MKREEREKKGKRRWKKRTADIRTYIRNGRRRIRRRKGLEGGRGSCVGEKHLTAGCTSFMVAHRALLTHLMSTDSIFLSTGIGGIFEPHNSRVKLPLLETNIRSGCTACVSEKIGHRSIRDFLLPAPCFFPNILSLYFSFFVAFRCIASACKTNSEDIVKMDSSKFGKLSVGVIINLHFCAMQGFPRIRPWLTISPT